jgi:putative SOS response-associated peptidase YedK
MIRTERVHDRMPFIIHPGNYKYWLGDREVPKYVRG